MKAQVGRTKVSVDRWKFKHPKATQTSIKMAVLRKSSFLYIFIAISVIFFIDSAKSKPIQVLKNIPGFISVYIRHGDEPLAEINPALAEAFHEEDLTNTVVPLELNGDLSSVDAENSKNESQDPFVLTDKKKRSLPRSYLSVLP